ncbi:MAG: tetratricopeptide repeat protein [Acidobacteria bacterium]|nr:tetratricopeptide repeat protein [Acidobacteriota bacterium]
MAGWGRVGWLLILLVVVFPAAGAVLQAQEEKPAVMADKERKWYLNYQDALDFIKEGRYQEAAQFLETTISQRTEPKSSIRMYGNIRRPYIPYFYLGVAQFHLGKYELAENNFRKSKQFGESLKLDEGKEIGGYLQQCATRIAELKEQGQPSVDPDYERALDLFTEEKYAQAKPLLEKVQGQGGPFAGKAADLLVKIAAFEAEQARVRQLQQEIDDLARRAQAAFAEGNFEQARDLYQEISRKKPDYPDVFPNLQKAENAVEMSRELGTARRLAKTQPSEAEELVEGIRQKNPQFPGLAEVAQLITQEKRKKELADKRAAIVQYMGEGMAAFQEGQWARAKRRFEDALGLGPTSDETREIRDFLTQIDEKLARESRIRDLLTQGRRDLQNDRRDEARVAFEQVLALEPGHGEARQFLTLLDRMSGADLTEEAVRMLKEGIRHFLLGQYPEAEASLNQYLAFATEKESLARFFLGAAQVSQYFIVQMQDQQLLRKGHDNLRQARSASGFLLTDRLRSLLSPRILEIYEKDHLDNP